MSENLTPNSESRVPSFSDIHRRSDSRPLLMGILNITPDSFFSNSRYSIDDAVKEAKAMIKNGADWIDIGGESTRPGASKISIEEETNRVIPVIKQLRNGNPEVMISIDTRNHQVARLAIENGANMINDVSGLRDKQMLDLVLETGCAICIMHMNGEPGNMQDNPSYSDVVEEVASQLEQKAEELVAKGHSKELIVIDPGIGFGKTQEHNLKLMKAIDRFKSSGYALLWGISRKSVIGNITGKTDASDRLSGTLASSLFASLNGVDMLRVHDIDEHSDLFKVYDALDD